MIVRDDAWSQVVAAATEATLEACSAYQFNPNSYTYSAMNAAVRVETRLKAIAFEHDLYHSGGEVGSLEELVNDQQRP